MTANNNILPILWQTEVIDFLVHYLALVLADGNRLNIYIIH